MAGSGRLPYQLTHVNTDDVLIKIWGIVDRERHMYIQNIIDIHADRLAHGIGAPDYRTELIPNKLVLVHHTERFKRALIIRAEPVSLNKKVLVRLVDSGHVISVRIDEIRDISEIPHLRALEDSPLAEEFILYGVLKSGPWNAEDSEWANRVLLFNSEVSFVHSVANKILLNIAVNDSKHNVLSYSSCLIKRGIAEGVSLEQQVSIIVNKYGFQMPNNRFQVSLPVIPNVMNAPRPPYPYSIPPAGPSSPTVPANVMSPHGFNYAKTRSPRPHVQARSPQPAPTPQVLPCQFGVETLKPGTAHEVYVSHVIEGMQSFTVQLKKNVDEKLTKLMAQINSIPPKPISTSLLPGTMCLGKAAEDQTLCRAVVSTVLGEGANLYFVDFGNSEIVPFNEIYEIPPEFIQENVMALRFTLANLSNNYALSTQEAQSIFEDLVENAEKLMMQVMQPEMPLKQYCELFLIDKGKTINVKQKVLDKVKLMKPAEYKKIPFKQNGVADVLISYVESPIRFFVQLEVNQSMLDLLMNTVEEYCVSSDMKELLYVEDVNENMAVCALYSADQKWYRGLIMDEPDNAGNVQVFYVDYGNQEACHFSNMRIMNNEMISKFPMQAIECRLDIDADFALREDVVSFFVDLVDANTYTMKVLNALPGHVLLVELRDASNVNVKDILLNQFNQNSPVAPITEPSVKQATSRGNWRERNNSSNDGDFSAFHQESARTSDTPSRNSLDSEESRSKYGRKRDFIDIDEIDTTAKKSDGFWGQDTRESRSRSKNGPTLDRSSKSRDDWRSNREEREDDSTDSKPYGKRGGNDGWSNNRDSNSGNNGSSWRRGSEDGDRKPFFKRRDDDNRRGNWDSDGGSRKPFRKRDGDDTWNTNRDDERDDRRAGFRKNDWDSNRSNDRSDRKSFRNDDRGSKDNDWNTNKTSESDDQGSKPKFDRDSRRDDSWGSKPRYDRSSRGQDDSRGGGSRQGSSSFGERKWGSRDSGFKKPSVTLMDGYEKGADFSVSNFDQGQQMEVVISWFTNPAQFFVIPADNAEFRSLMEIVQTDYPQRKPVEISSLQPNDSVVARDKDDVIYRAKVLRTRPGAVLVSFVDYGNVASVRQDQVWTISSEHCSIPVQAVCCSLYNITPVGEDGQWSPAANLDKYFSKEKYTLTFVDCHDETSSKTWFVSLVDENGEDIAESMVVDGLAVRNTVLQSEELYDFSLLRNQVLTVFPGHIESSKKFFVHIEPHKANSILQMITDLTADPNNLTPLPSDKFVEGEFCLAPSDDEVYYRALILSVDEGSQQAHILYVDYGDENDISIDKIKVLPDSLMIYNTQFVECCLYEGESFTNEQAFSEAISETDFMIKVMDVVDEKLLVYVYDINGTRLPFPVENKESVSAVCALPILKRFENVVISHIAQDNVYIQRAADELFILDLNEKLHNKYNDEEAEKVSMEPDIYYAAKSTKFQAWYRCKILTTESTEVFYIDYGNTEPIEDLIAIKILEKDFFISPAFATAVSTIVRFTSDDLSPLINAVEGLIFEAVFERGATGNELLADLKDSNSGKTFVQFAVESGCGSEIKSESSSQSYVAFADWQPGVQEKVIVSHVSSPTSFYVQSLNDANKIATVQENLQSALKKLLPIVGYIEGLCAAQKADRSWCRARVSQKGKLAFAVDFGFEFTPQTLKRLPKSYLLDTSTYVAECALNIEPIGDVWDKESSKRLADVTKNGNEVIAELEYVKNNKKIIDLIADGVNVSEILVNEGLARHKSFKVFVSHAVSLKEFYIQEVEYEDQLFDLGDKLKEADNWDTAEASVGEVVAAKFVDDGLWYRAVVLKANDEGKTVKFIDYGNESPCEEFRMLPKELKSIPSFAFKCSQHPLPNNSDELKEKFVNLVTGGEGSYSVYFLSHIEPKLVMLYYNDVSIDEALQQLAAESSHSELQPSAENSVAVSHINSPSSFYTQAFDDTLAQVETLLADIENAEVVTEATVGDIVAALFPEDGIWYRAKVTDTSDVMITVFFVDYGNSCVVEQLRKLDESGKTLPFLAMHCTLQLPHDVDDWSEKANERFIELAASGATAFNLIVKEEAYPAVVDLLTNGCSVTEELIALCKVEDKVSDSVAVCHINSPSSFYVQAENAALDTVAALLADVETNEIVTEPVIDDLVAALFPDDGVWYRAKITDKSDESISVQFVDYGNSCVVDQLRNLSDEVKALPYMAKHCAFSLPVGLEQWPEAAKQRLSELTGDGNTIFKLIVQEEGDPAYVDLQENGVSVADELATLCKADLSAPVRKTEKPLAVLSHVHNSHEMWVQYQTPHLDEMMNEMASAETFDPLEIATEGNLVAAVFDEDGLWYRAKIVEVKENEYRVLFIDYGNDTNTTAIRSLPEDLISLPSLAKRCRLAGLPQNVELCPEDVYTRLKEMESAAQVFAVTELNEDSDGDVTLVSLSYDGKDLLIELMGQNPSMCKNQSETAEAEAAENIIDDEILADSGHDDISKLDKVNAAESVIGICENHQDLPEVTKSEISSEANVVLEVNTTKTGNEDVDEVALSDDENFDSVSSDRETYCTVPADVVEEIFVEDSCDLVSDSVKTIPADRVNESCEAVSNDLPNEERIFSEYSVDQNEEMNIVDETEKMKKLSLEEIDTTVLADNYNAAITDVSAASLETTCTKVDSNETLVDLDEPDVMQSDKNFCDAVSHVKFADVDFSNDSLSAACESISKDIDEIEEEITVEEPYAVEELTTDSIISDVSVFVNETKKMKKLSLEEIDTTVSADDYDTAAKDVSSEMLETTTVEAGSEEVLVDVDESNVVRFDKNVYDTASLVELPCGDILPAACGSVSNDISEEVTAEKPFVTEELKTELMEPALDLKLPIIKQSVNVEFEISTDLETNKIEGKSELCSVDDSYAAQLAHVDTEGPIQTGRSFTEHENYQIINEETEISSLIQMEPSAATDETICPSSEINKSIKVSMPADFTISAVVSEGKIVPSQQDIKEGISVPVSVTKNVVEKFIESVQSAARVTEILEKSASYDEFKPQIIENNITLGIFDDKKLEKFAEKTESAIPACFSVQDVTVLDEIEMKILKQSASVSVVVNSPSEENYEFAEADATINDTVQEESKYKSKNEVEIFETSCKKSVPYHNIEFKKFENIPVNLRVEKLEKFETSISKTIAFEVKKEEKLVSTSPTMFAFSKELKESIKTETAINKPIQIIEKLTSESRTNQSANTADMKAELDDNEATTSADAFKSEVSETIQCSQITMDTGVESQRKIARNIPSVGIKNSPPAEASVLPDLRIDHKNIVHNIIECQYSCDESNTTEIKIDDSVEADTDWFSRFLHVSDLAREHNEPGSTIATTEMNVVTNEKIDNFPPAEASVLPVPRTDLENILDEIIENQHARDKSNTAEIKNDVSVETDTDWFSRYLHVSDLAHKYEDLGTKNCAAEINVVADQKIEHSPPVEVPVPPIPRTDPENEITENQYARDESGTVEIKNDVSVETDIDWFGRCLDVSDLTHKYEDLGTKNRATTEGNVIKNQEIDLVEKLGDSNSSVYFDSFAEVHFSGDGPFDESFCYITEARNPSSFYVQKLSMSSQLKDIENKLRQASDTTLEIAEIGAMAGANIQNMLLRVKVMDSDNYNGFTVFCVDYGTESTCSCLFKLPRELETIPPLALHCAIQLPCFLREWPVDVCEMFDDITSSSKSKFCIQVEEAGDDILFVNLFKDGIDVGEKLRALCDDFGSESDIFESPTKQE